jgi:hypothetical protein
MTISLRNRLVGAHVHVTVFLDHANTGTLIMHPAEWLTFNTLLSCGQAHLTSAPDRIVWDPATDDTETELLELMADHVCTMLAAFSPTANDSAPEKL